MKEASFLQKLDRAISLPHAVCHIDVKMGIILQNKRKGHKN